MNVDPASNSDVTNHEVASPHRMKRLPVDFVPSKHDVICGRGKKCYSHIGNDRFKTRVHSFLNLYRSARTKVDKSKVLNMVVEQVRQDSPNGGFVKQDESGRWHEVGDFLAREKTSQVFRDALHDNYKSSSVAKKKRRQEELTKASDKLKMPRSAMDIARKIESMSLDMKNSAKIAPQRSFSHNDAILEGMQYASRDMRQDPTRHEKLSSPGASRISNVPGFNFEFEPDECSEDQNRDRATSSFRQTMRRQTQHATTEWHVGQRYSEKIVSQRASSVPTVPPDSFDFDDGLFSQSSGEVHRSLPNLQFEPDDFGVDETERLYQSAPNIAYFSSSDLLQPEQSSPAIVPATVEFPSRREDTHSIDLARWVGRTRFMHESQPGTGIHRDPDNLLGHINRGLVREGRPIVAPSGIFLSLERFAGMPLDDDNPFEPIPINPNAISPKHGTNADEEGIIGDPHSNIGP